jgi:hypothetical protein
VLPHRFQYLNVYSNIMSVHPEGGGSALDTKVSLINADMVFGLVKCCWMSHYPMVCRGTRHMVTALSILHNLSHSDLVVGGP